MPRGLNQLTNAANNIEARVDWHAQVNRAYRMGLGSLAGKYAPKGNVHLTGWRQLDRCTKALREALDAVPQVEPAPELGDRPVS